MKVLNELFQKNHNTELILVIVFILYLVLGLKTPDIVANLVDNLIGKITIILIVLYLFLYANPILAVLSAFVAFDLMRRSSETTGIDALKKYAPSEEKKMSQFTAFNQFPYTLEQEVVAKMAPLVHNSYPINNASYKPMLNKLYDASPI